MSDADRAPGEALGAAVGDDLEALFHRDPRVEASTTSLPALLAAARRRRARERLAPFAVALFWTASVIATGFVLTLLPAPFAWSWAATWWFFTILFTAFSWRWRRTSLQLAGMATTDSLAAARQLLVGRLLMLRQLPWLVALQLVAVAAVNLAFNGTAALASVVATSLAVALVLAIWWRRDHHRTRAGFEALDRLLGEASHVDTAPAG